MQEEIWKSLKNIVELGDYYEVSNFGSIRSVDRVDEYLGRKRKGKIITKSKDTKGYLRVELHLDGRKKRYKVHRLVAMTFIPNKENKPQVNHIDGDKTNNYVNNLEWSTNGENNKHAYDIGLKPKKISNEDKHWIKKVYKPYDKEFGSRALAKKFGVGQATISDIALNWKGD